MKLIIDISEKDYVEIKEYGINAFPSVAIAIQNGTPLPKGHGKIGDLDRLYNVFERNVVSASAFKDLFDIAPAIIEADKGETDNE